MVVVAGVVHLAHRVVAVHLEVVVVAVRPVLAVVAVPVVVDHPVSYLAVVFWVHHLISSF